MTYLKRSAPIYLMILPGCLFFLIFKYVPMLGLVIAFQQYNLFQGFWSSEWVGLENFIRLFSEKEFWILLKNTLLLNLIDIAFYFPAPMILAVLLNEVRLRRYKNTVQTIMYAPHFISWVVIVGITLLLFSTQKGGFNELLVAFGLERIDILTNEDAFRFVWLFQNIWQGAGWGAIIFLASLASVDPTLYEAAVVDGANRWRQIWHITIPALRQVIVILFILRLGHFIDIGFEHIYLLQNPLNLSTSDVFDTYVYRNGVLRGDFSYTTTVGLFKSVVGLVLVIVFNSLAKKFGQEGVY